MRRRIAVPITLAVFALAACGGGDDGNAAGTPEPGDGVEAPTQTATPNALGSLPPAFFECLADQGVVVESPDEIHSVPQEALQACFASLHQGGGAPSPGEPDG
jgi:hypothetical protein